MSDLSNRATTRRAISRPNARKALARIQAELETLVHFAPVEARTLTKGLATVQIQKALKLVALLYVD